MALSERWLHLLRSIQSYSRGGARTVTAQQLGVSPAALSPLVKGGLLMSFENSERVRGERRAYWREYKLSDAGRAALAEHDGREG